MLHMLDWGTVLINSVTVWAQNLFPVSLYDKSEIKKCKDVK